MYILPVLPTPAHFSLLHVQGRLALLGWRSVSQWATAMGYDPDHVRKVITRSSSKRRIYGQSAMAILKDLNTTLTAGITPESLAGEVHA